MKQRRKGRMSRILVLALLVFLLTGLLSPASAAVNIGDPAVLHNGDTVYYGMYPQATLGKVGVAQAPAGIVGKDYIIAQNSEDNDADYYYAIEPIEWRVLARNSNELMLLSEKNLDIQPYHMTQTATPVTWEGSTVRSWLNGYVGDSNIANQDYSAFADNYSDSASFSSNAFKAAERAAILQTSLVNASSNDGLVSGGNGTNDQIFLLSLADIQWSSGYFVPAPPYTITDLLVAVNTAFVGEVRGGYSEDDSDYWWLRTPGNHGNQFAAIVTDNGSPGTNGFAVNDDETCIRPAFNLDLSSVLFSSDASGTMKSGATVGGDLVDVADPTGAVKMTVLSDYNANANPTGLGLTVTDTSARTAAPGATVDIAYTGAQTGANRSVSVLLCDSVGDLLYYGRPADCATTASGTASFTVPSTLSEGSYTIKIFNEEVNAANYTDFASTPQSISLTVGASQNKLGDVDQNGVVDAADLSVLLGDFNKSGSAISNPRSDIDGNGIVDAGDLSILLANFNT